MSEDALVLLHGFGGSTRSWQPMIRLLDLPGPVIAPDLPGHGDNPLPADLDLAEMLTWFDAVLDARGLGGRVALAGHSLGGLLALHLALNRPRTISRLVLLATAAQVTLHPDLLDQVRAHRIDLASLADCFRAALPASDFASVVTDLERTRLADPVTDVWGVCGRPIWDRVAEIEAPALVLTAQDDLVISARHGRRLAASLPGSSSHTLAATGHYAHLERPGLVARHLGDFLGDPAPAELASYGGVS